MADGKVPELMVEQILLGEMPPERRAEIERRLGSEELERRLDKLRRSNAEILARHPPAQVAVRLAERAAGGREESSGAGQAAGEGIRVERPRLRAIGGARLLVPLAAAAALAVAAVTLPRLAERGWAPGVAAQEATRIKGLPQLLVYRRGRSGPELLAARAVVREGDVLQIKYVPSGRPYGAIVSVDGRGAVTLHFPEAVDGPTALEPGQAAVLDYAYQLDDAPGFERFFFVTSRRAFAASVVVEAAKRLSRSGAREEPLELPRGFEQVSELFVKGE